MDNMKARGFLESEMPLPAASDPEVRQRLDDLARALVASAKLVSGLLHSAVRNALFSAGATVKLDAALLNAVRERLWEETETYFFALLKNGADDSYEERGASRGKWLDLLRVTALALFDEAAPLTADSGTTQAARTGKARRTLGFALRGYGPAGRELFNTLSQSPVEPAELKRKRKAA